MKYLNVPIICAAVAFGLLGSAKGLDESLIATVDDLPSFIKDYQLHASDLSAAERANRLSNITSMLHLGSLPGGLIAFFSSHFIGPLWTMRQLCTLWIIGMVVFLTSAGNLKQCIAGRFVMGLGVGQAGVVGPIYLAEVAPISSRGLLVGAYASSEYIGVLIGYFAGYGASLHISNHTSAQWVLPESSQLIMAIVLLVFSIGCVESPRYSVYSGHTSHATQSLAKLWGLSPENPRVVEGVKYLEDEMATKFSTSKSAWSWLEPWKLLFGQTANIYRLYQWSGTNAITTYAPKFFDLLNVTGKSETLLKTAIFGVVKLVTAITSALFFIDRIGRKRTLLFGIILQLLALLYVSIFITAWDAQGEPQSGNALRAAIGAVAAIYVTGIGYAFGWNSIQYLINAEILPSPVRTLGTSLLMCIHYANKFALVKVLPSMMLVDALQPIGTFWFFFAVALIGLVWGILWLPETSRRSLEETSETIPKVTSVSIVFQGCHWLVCIKLVVGYFEQTEGRGLAGQGSSLKTTSSWAICASNPSLSPKIDGLSSGGENFGISDEYLDTVELSLCYIY
ncbi:quinate permease [Penicillium angulare]|uniref:quinate permease n=1 Tax=Penicillium angulare TaxID=116970 RepID=UPI00253FA7D9|nr:quinate permease [Penicillium angulare]KAJ5287561.1 quinate permease [Penicillium angulare]